MQKKKYRSRSRPKSDNRLASLNNTLNGTDCVTIYSNIRINMHYNGIPTAISSAKWVK